MRLDAQFDEQLKKLKALSNNNSELSSGVASALQPGQRERNMLLPACWFVVQATDPRDFMSLKLRQPIELRLGSAYGAG